MCPCCVATVGFVMAGEKSRQAPMRSSRRSYACGGQVSPPGHSTRKPEMMLKNKVAVIDGAGGAVGSAVARAFAREGAMDLMQPL
jgi:hypothetical protein